VMPQTMRYLNRRSEALLEVGMGLGEYLYLYTVAYPCWLGTPVDDGPPFVGTGMPARWQVGGGAGDPGERRDRMRERLSAMLLPMLRHQLEDVRAAGPAGGDPSWAARLRGEIERMEQDPRRLPWQDGLPEATAASLEPFRDRLEAQYDPLCHPVELAVQQ